VPKGKKEKRRKGQISEKDTSGPAAARTASLHCSRGTEEGKGEKKGGATTLSMRRRGGGAGL